MFFDMPAARSEQIMNSRELRAKRQSSLLTDDVDCIISFTLNIPGAQKQFSLAKAAHAAGIRILLDTFPTMIDLRYFSEPITGSEALFSINGMPAEEVKRRTIQIEQSHPLGRLFDIDVLDSNGSSISRAKLGFPSRPCMLCGDNAKICGRTMRHPISQLQEYIINSILSFLLDETSAACGNCALRSMLYEVSVTPKPGLVDRSGNGAHTDMDFFTFLDSTAALAPEFSEMFRIGWKYCSKTPEELFEALRLRGLEAEAQMFRSTHGINTHKGLIFSFSLLCGTLGSLYGDDPLRKPTISALLQKCAGLASFSQKDFIRTDSFETHGLVCYRNYHASGIRGEAASGFPTVMNISLPIFKKSLENGYSVNDASVITLLKLIAETQDTNMLHRGGENRAESARKRAAELLLLAPEKISAAVEILDQEFINENLSPGGCADLLAITLFLQFLQEKEMII